MIKTILEYNIKGGNPLILEVNISAIGSMHYCIEQLQIIEQYYKKSKQITSRKFTYLMRIGSEMDINVTIKIN